MSEPQPFRIGLLGHGTVGAAFEELLAERADAIAAEVGFRPEISGVLTTSRGDFDDILERSDLIVELMGGTEPALDYALRAMEAGQALRDRQQAAGLAPRRGAVRGGGPRPGCSCASRPRSAAWCPPSA